MLTRNGKSDWLPEPLPANAAPLAPYDDEQPESPRAEPASTPNPPTTATSWLNQIEVWFSILSRQALQGLSFTSSKQLRQPIADFVEVYNQQAAPFEWTKAVVFPSAPRESSEFASRF